MSKRRNRSAVPSETLERARQQAAETPTAERPTRTRVRRDGLDDRDLIQARGGKRRGAAPEQMTIEEIEYKLENPTREVSEDELRGTYTYVMKDLRSMALLAASLMVVLFVLAQFLPR